VRRRAPFGHRYHRFHAPLPSLPGIVRQIFPTACRLGARRAANGSCRRRGPCPAADAAHLGQPLCFVLAITAIVAWALTGPIFKFNNTWQLVINTGTTIITFLMVFLIQNTQNRDTEAMQIKLDELIRAASKADNALMDLEEMEDKELDALRRRYEAIARKARSTLEQRQKR
jgi:low affinity Fe/Cu permease